jgi:hypothetical protein
LLDTRPGFSTVDGQFAGIGKAAAKSVTKVKIAGRGGVPANATAAIVNLTLINVAAKGYATIYPCTATPPNASNINYVPGTNIANSVVAQLNSSGEVCVYTLAAADIAIDVNGFAPPGASVGTLAPGRLADTRAGFSTVDGQFAGVGKRAADSVTKVKIAGRGGVPANATTAIINLTMINVAARGFATIFPCTATPPNASHINYVPGTNIANGVVAQLNATGELCVYTKAAADFAIDISGYVA